jgi:DNA repair protein RadC
MTKPKVVREPGVKGLTGPTLYKATVKEWPENERPREKLLNHGPETLTEAELLAILLRTGSAKENVIDMAKTLFREHGESLSALAARNAKEMQAHGLGMAKAITIVAAFELGRRKEAEQKDQKRQQVRSSKDIVKLFAPLMRDLQYEVFKVILLDSASKILRSRDISKGILNSSLVHPREVFKYAVMEAAASIIVLHNHPSGNPDPSAEDRSITRQLVEAGKTMWIPVVDHIIIAGNEFTSFADKGWL